ncbi:hypothetical protein BJ684DRAFT_16838 [Piptocephalis cylindrospora]|uniref:Uncharacterized protein n=1 Tax=Piptocephalis cylindrospora TaxID=1907219 RepID=A0A4P9Y1T1_9FUNG|nr:hypothetical protein BJ684DRAFT_16838 [Piptocephalis cylindrospora]|eukprot:RKP12703.1 hypothetical protein BJ684DRAFT_16838 [Piptocephalis cylindrospora]
MREGHCVVDPLVETIKGEGESKGKGDVALFPLLRCEALLAQAFKGTSWLPPLLHSYPPLSLGREASRTVGKSGEGEHVWREDIQGGMRDPIPDHHEEAGMVFVFIHPGKAHISLSLSLSLLSLSSNAPFPQGKGRVSPSLPTAIENKVASLPQRKKADGDLLVLPPIARIPFDVLNPLADLGNDGIFGELQHPETSDPKHMRTHESPPALTPRPYD